MLYRVEAIVIRNDVKTTETVRLDRTTGDLYALCTSSAGFSAQEWHHAGRPRNPSCVASHTLPGTLSYMMYSTVKVSSDYGLQYGVHKYNKYLYSTSAI